MTKTKYIGISAAGLAVAGLLVGGFIVMHGHRSQAGQNSSEAYGAEAGIVSQQAANAGGGSNSIPLNQAGPAPSADSGLSVSSSNASSSIGQLDGSQKQAAASGGGSGAGAAAPRGLDPSTFGEYQKYKDSPHALFGELQAGSGTELTANHKAAVYYRGWLTNGQLFDESKPGSDGKLQPFIFTLGAHQVIPGWEESLNGMKVGGVRLVIVPPAVGYGATGQGSIPPNAVLVFQVQLAAVE